MATKKKLLQAAAGTAAASGGAGALNVEDVFSTYLYEGNGSSQVIENGINLGQSYGSGSGYFSGSATGVAITGNGEYLQTPTSTDFALSNSDFTIEFFVNVSNGAGNNNIIFSFGAGTSDYDPLIIYTNITSTTADLKFYGSSSGTSWNFVSNALIGTVTFGTWHHVALVRSGGSFYLFLDGVLGSTTSVSTTSFAQSANQISIGRAQNDKRFYGYLSDFHYVKGTALYTSAFTAPTSTLSAVANTKLLILQQTDILSDNSSSSHSMTEVDGSISASSFGPFDAADAGEGGLVWTKDRDTAVYHALTDTERGGQYALYSNTADAQVDRGSDFITSFNANGYSIGADGLINDTYSYASWTFRKAPKFFTCLTYTGTGSAQNISHDLGSDVGFLLIKRTDSTSNWRCWHRGLPGTGSNMEFNQTGAYETATAIFNGTDPTSTQFSVGTNSNVNASGGTYVAYLFAHNDGDGEFGPDGDADIIKCGSYTGTGSSSHLIDLGFEPQWLLIKNTDASEAWIIQDNMRSMTDTDYAWLYANGSNNEAGGGLSGGASAARPTGFEINLTGANINASGNTYIYIAIRRGPMAVPTDATDVFAIDTYDAPPLPTFKSSFVTDMALYKHSALSQDWKAVTRLLGATRLTPNAITAETAESDVTWDFMDGWYKNTGTASTVYSWMWKRAPSFCDVVAYTGTGSSQTVSHNLGVAPEMMWVKGRNYVENWIVYHSAEGATKYLQLNTTGASSTSSSAWNNTAPTDTGFTVGTLNAVNESGYNYIAYLFASLDGVSKVGSYTGSSSAQTIDCGFSSGARFVMIKNVTDSGTNWIIFDAERGIVSGNDPYLFLNANSAEDVNGSYDYLDPHSSGFTLEATNFFDTNDDGKTYIFYAVA